MQATAFPANTNSPSMYNPAGAASVMQLLSDAGENPQHNSTTTPRLLQYYTTLMPHAQIDLRF